MFQALRFESAVPKRFVHRQAISEVYLTDCVQTREADRFQLGAQWPRLHAFYRTSSGRHDTMLMAETARQCAIYLAHLHYHVPLGHKFTMQRMQVHSNLDMLTIGPDAAEITIDAQVADLAYRRGRLAAFTVTSEFRVDGRLVGTCLSVANVLTPSEYVRVRWPGDRDRAIGRIPLPVPLLPEVVGVPDAHAVVLGAHPSADTGGRWVLRSNLAHPVLFDHPCDHVPGAVLLEAARQGARAQLRLPCADVERLEIRFRRFIELDEPTTVDVRAEPRGDTCVDVVFSQWGVVKASGMVQLSRSHDRCVAGCGFPA